MSQELFFFFFFSLFVVVVFGLVLYNSEGTGTAGQVHAWGWASVCCS